MIRESEHFHFAGRRSTDFNIRNIKISDGFYNEQITPSRSIEEVYIAGRVDPYFINVREEPKTLELSFYFADGWDRELMERVIRWLDVKTYQPLYFSADLDKVYYALPINGIDKIHNGLKQGYLTLEMRCSSSRATSHQITSPIHDTRKLSSKQGVNKPIIKIGNKGFVSIYPELWIEKVSKGNLTINNLTDNNKMFELKNIDIGEKLHINGQNETIDTDKERVYRYDDFNGNYLELIYGENILSLSNNMKIRFRYRYLFS